MNHGTEQMMELSVGAHAADGREELLHILQTASDLYHRELDAAREANQQRYGTLREAQFSQLCRQAGIPRAPGTDRAEALSLLLCAEWTSTPTAMAFASIAEHAAQQGVCLLPEIS
ncbi:MULTISPECIES: hypothetical protein [unclassified Streptomyces]|uniref:hypothetical protein n=1 Tax=unclassified Streptomyces TaxID=2593676 RepID=UPI002DD98400|nr:hypothetical protein [Streptomyces sp. NBC_01795]WSA97765.1 hypothetical protein OIE63_40475 [Streptomyces sp. NBC_01795]WSS46718.1 hypothetical protein OG220_39745 [Streptomyces sp. NBC_01187]WSS47065.1 hypothetical protein OG220_41880 [Streptomyces sp. NBC_01187]